MAEDSNICNALEMGLDVQGQFNGYKVAVCLRGMGPTHMVVINQSSDSSRYSVKSLPLQVTRQPKGHEDSTTVGLRTGSYVFYRAKEDGITYEVDISRDGSATFSITSSSSQIYSDWTVDVEYGDLIPPRK
ncbi:hypothetical protein VB716_12745 [Synechococcus sp. CCY9201]|nr:hypothetical protein [Synechococcus sp. CCY9201]